MSHEDPTRIFSLKQKLRKGSFGTVYRGESLKDGEEVAIKMVRERERERERREGWRKSERERGRERERERCIVFFPLHKTRSHSQPSSTFPTQVFLDNDAAL